MKYKKQVEENHYSLSSGYVDLPRWVSYFHQIMLVSKISSNTKKNKLKILEIGVGNKIVATMLEMQNHEVKTLDIDEKLGPDFVDTLPELNKVGNHSFDVILCSQVLEHIKYEDAIVGIENMLKITDFLIVSVPNRVLHFSLLLKISKLKTIRYLLQSSFPAVSFKFDGQHYWELGAKGSEFNKFRNDISKKGLILEEFTPVENTYHHFFLIRKFSYGKNK